MSKQQIFLSILAVLIVVAIGAGIALTIPQQTSTDSDNETETITTTESNTPPDNKTDTQTHIVTTDTGDYRFNLPSTWTYRLYDDGSVVAIFQPKDSPRDDNSIADFSLVQHPKPIGQNLEDFYNNRGSQNLFLPSNAFAHTVLDLTSGEAIYFKGVSGKYGGNIVSINFGTFVLEIADIFGRGLDKDSAFLNLVESIQVI